MQEFHKLAEERLTYEVPGFIKAVRHYNADVVTTSLQAFHRDPMLLYMAAWYATSHGKGIVLAAMTEPKDDQEWTPPDAA